MALLIVVRDINDYIWYALIHSLAIAGNNVFNIIHLRGKVHFLIKDLEIKKHMKPVLILLASSISIELYTLLDTTMLGAWCADNVVGYYSNATKLARLINSTISSIALVLLPRLSYLFSSGHQKELDITANRVLKILVSLVVPAAVGVFLLAKDIIIILFGTSFEPATLTLRILSILIFAVALNNFFGTQILMTFGQEKKLLVSVICGATINVTLNAFLIKMYFQNGAAFASAFSEICVLLLTFLYARKYVSFIIDKAYWQTLIEATVCMGIMVYFVTRIGFSRHIELIVGIVVGMVSYFGVGILDKNSGICDIIHVSTNVIQRIKKRITR